MQRGLTLLILLSAPVAVAQAPPADRALAGVIDIHVHAAPDSTPRSIDAIDLAKLAQSRGMRALVFKDHFAPTAATAYLVHKVVPGIEVFGGVDLNLSVGGMNPAAVEKMALTTGHLGRFVWMGTTDTCAAAARAKIVRACVAVAHDGVLLQETKAVIATMAKDGLILATGHNSADDDLLLIREARAQGIDHIVVTHAMLSPTYMSVAQMQEAAKLGAYVEFVYNGLTGAKPEFDFAAYAKAIHAVGAEHCILSSDMGQPNNPLHPDGLLLLFAGLEKAGVNRQEIEAMSRVNPAKLLGLTPPN